MVQGDAVPADLVHAAPVHAAPVHGQPVDDRERRPLWLAAGIGAVVGLVVLAASVVVLRSTAGGSSGPSCTMERTLECVPEGMGRTFDLILVLLAVLVVAVGALVLGLLLLLVAWLANRKRSKPPGRGMRVLVAVGAGFAAFGVAALAVVFAS
ncbi:MAG: hypothetical protein U0Q07_05845 [Acidimicrobiales bacterium]